VEVILPVGGMQECDSPLAGQVLFHRIQGFLGITICHANPRHHTHPLRFNKDPPLVALPGANGSSKIIICPAEPFPIPACIIDDFFHLQPRFPDAKGFSHPACPPGYFFHLPAGKHKQPGNEYAFSHSAILIGCGLERLSGLIGETIEIEAVIPIRSPNQRQTMWTPPVQRVLDGFLQVNIEGLLAARLVVKGDRFIQDLPVTRFFKVSSNRENQPERIVIEITSNVIIAALGQGLVLVICSTGGQLRGSQVQDTLPRPRWNQVHKAQ